MKTIDDFIEGFRVDLTTRHQKHQPRGIRLTIYRRNTTPSAPTERALDLMTESDANEQIASLLAALRKNARPK